MRIQNIPLSADDGIIKRVLVLKGLDVISCTREKLRINGKLTNCETGDRLVTVKTSTLKSPLERFMHFGQFKAKVIHKGQIIKTLKCSRCLEVGHTIHTCKNNVKCLSCGQSDHKKGECDDHTSSAENESNNFNSSVESDVPNTDQHTTTPITTGMTTNAQQSPKHAGKPRASTGEKSPNPRRGKKAKSTNKSSDSRNQSNIDRFLSGMRQQAFTPNKQRSQSVTRSPPTPTEMLNDVTKKACGNQRDVPTGN